jgi:hypothetical protein
MLLPARVCQQQHDHQRIRPFSKCYCTKPAYGADINLCIVLASLFLPLSCRSLLQPTPPAHALLTAGDPIKNASAILRYALPINNKPIRQVQVRLSNASAAFAVHQHDRPFCDPKESKQ